MAYTLRDQAQGGCGAFRGQRPLAGQEAAALLALAGSRDPLEAAVGLAVAGALVPPEPAGALEGDVLDHLALEAGDTVGMVGYFGPLVPEVRRRAVRAVHLRAHRPAPGRGPAPRSGRPSSYPAARWLSSAPPPCSTKPWSPCWRPAPVAARWSCWDPAHPLYPEAFAFTPLTMLSGVKVRDPEGLLQVVAEAGGTRQFIRMVEKKNLRLRPAALGLIRPP